MFKEWSEKPGSLNYASQKTLTLYGLDIAGDDDSSQLTQIKAKKVATLKATTTEAFTGLHYLPQSGSVDYVPKETYEFAKEAEVKTESISHLNLGALSLWHQIQNPFDFQISFKMLSILHD